MDVMQMMESSERDTAREASSSKSPAPKRKRQNVTRACTFCRKKRTKCDGKPRCATCSLHGETCSYEGDLDRRKPATKQYIEGLEHRIRQLEAATRSPEQDGHSPSFRARSTTNDAEEIAPARGAHLRGAGALKASRADFVAHYGPSSAYMHLPDEPFQDDEAQDEGLPKTGLHVVDWDQVQWSRHLPHGAIPDTQAHTNLLSVFFCYINDWCQWADESSFVLGLRASAASETPLRLAHYSPFFHCIVLCMALLLSPESMPSRDWAQASARTLIEHARGLIEQEALRPMTTTVRGLMLMGSYHFHHGARNLGWLYEGMGARMCQILGLNIDCENLVEGGFMSARTKLLRDKTFYTVYIQDTLWSFNVGRTASLHTGDFETVLPPIDPDEDAEPWRPLLGNSQPGWRSSVFHHAGRLTFLADRIHQALYRVQPRDTDSNRQATSRLNVALNTWYMELPTTLHSENWQVGSHPPYFINLHATYHYMRILLHRPTYLRRLSVTAEEAQISESTCVSASHELHKLFTYYQAAGCMRYSTTSMPNIVFTAGTIFLLYSVQNDRTPREMGQALMKVNDCVNFLAEMAWPTAAVARDMLRRLRQEWTRSTASRPGSPTPTGPSMKTIAALQDPDSDLYKLAKDLGWGPPKAPASQDVGQNQPSVPTLDPGFNSTATDPTATLFAPMLTDPTVPGMDNNDFFSVWPYIWSDLPGPDFPAT